MAKVFLTDGSEAYMIVATPTGKKFFRVRSELLRLGEIGFFEKVMESAEELTLSQASEMGFVERKGQ
ncbi:MAG: hypothetical protein HY295_00195 [Thaumarchaeota archaeon]|nr:hypothetical protein [Nitrososphaerota archaeon]